MGKTNTWAEAFLVFTMLASVYALAITVFWAEWLEKYDKPIEPDPLPS